MARNEWIARLKEQIAELDMVIMTATRGELDMLESARASLAQQLQAMQYPRVVKMAA